MSDARGFRKVGYIGCPGGGQVVVQDGIAYVGHMKHPAGTSLIDVRDPARPRLLAHIEMPAGTHSHKVRVHDGIMITNREVLPRLAVPDGFRGGVSIWDVSRPAAPREITRWETPGQGVHRFDFDGRYAYLSPTMDGYRGNIVLIMDISDPARPEEVGRWWMPGQWEAGGETPTWDGTAHRCHHPLRRGDRLYVSYWHGGFAILDVSDMSKPTLVSHLDWSPPFPWPTHTALPLPYRLQGRDILVVADEDVARLHPSYPSFLWLVDITDERRPVPFSSFQLDTVDGSEQPDHSGCHQPCEKVTGTEIPVAWFANGLRLIDIKNPHAPTEVGHYVPDPASGSERPQTNDVTVDDNGLVYIIDRVEGLTILERT
jgi:hypothetical protein